MRYLQRAIARLRDAEKHVSVRDPGDALAEVTSALRNVAAAAAELVAWQRRLGITWEHIAEAAECDVGEALRCWGQPARGLLRMDELDRRRRLRERARWESQHVAGLDNV